MAYNELLPKQGVNKWNSAGAPAPPGWAPQNPQGATLQNVQGWGNPDVQAQTNPLSTTPAPPAAPPPPAKFMNPPSGAGTPPPATNPNALMSGTMTLPGSPGAVAGVGPEGGLAENQAWKTAVATGNPGGTGQIPGVGGSLNVMSPEQNAAISANPNFRSAGGLNSINNPGAFPSTQGGGAGTGEVWAGREGQLLRDRLTQNMNLAMEKANAPFTGERGTSADTGGDRQQWANLAKEFGDTLNSGFNSQGTERGVAAGHALEGAELPSKIAKNIGEVGYYNAHGEALKAGAAAKDEIAGNQLEIAKLRAGAGKYGNTAEASEYLKGEGFAPNPQTIEAFNAGGKVVPATKAVSHWFGGSTPAIPKHMIPPDWKPTMGADGKQKTTPEGLPLYTDAAGNANRQPTIIGK